MIPPEQNNTYRILLVDDDLVIRKIIEYALNKAGHEVLMAANGSEGLQQAHRHQPDLVITDMMMPIMDGFELTRRLRQDPQFAHLPILILTSQAELEDKLAAFEAGANDHLPKPFETAELLVRVGALLRHTAILKQAKLVTKESRRARIIAVHSLRGGVGSSTMAVNLAVALQGIWRKPTILVDLVFTAGQVGLMLNHNSKRSWADLSRYETHEIDSQVVQSIIGQHTSGLSLVLGPTNPVDAEKIPNAVPMTGLALLRNEYEYMVVDLPHNLQEMTLNALDCADVIVLLLSPELASVRAASIALDTYRRLGYDDNKVKMVLNWTFAEGGLSSKKVSDALHHPISLVLPFAPQPFVMSINHGTPLLLGAPTHTISALLEDFAFRLSKKEDIASKPLEPTEAWVRVHNRLTGVPKPKEKSRSLWLL